MGSIHISKRRCSVIEMIDASESVYSGQMVCGQQVSDASHSFITDCYDILKSKVYTHCFNTKNKTALIGAKVGRIFGTAVGTKVDS